MARIATTLARLVRDTRIQLDITQRDLARAVGVARSHIAAIEAARANPSLALIERLSEILQLDLDLAASLPTVVRPRQRDLVHVWCVAYIDRRLRASGLLVRREVELVVGRSHGWIDLAAFDPRTGTLFVIEVKTRLDDVGAVERQIAWYERDAVQVAHRLSWRPRRVVCWVIALASEEVEASVRLNRDALRSALPDRALAMRRALLGDQPPASARGLALIDPSSRRRAWLIPTRVDGRRSTAPYRDYADAARRREAAARPRD